MAEISNIRLIGVTIESAQEHLLTLGLATAGLACALQRVIKAVAGYFVILRVHSLTVGGRITRGGSDAKATLDVARAVGLSLGPRYG